MRSEKVCDIEELPPGPFASEIMNMMNSDSRPTVRTASSLLFREVTDIFPSFFSAFLI